MAIFSEADLANFGTLAVNLAFKDTCDIERMTRSWDAQGGDTLTWAPANASPIPCMAVDARFPAEQIVAEQLTDRMDKIISLPRLTDICKEDRVYVYSDGDTTRTTKYHVLGVVEPSTYEVIRRVVATREDVPR